jgi:hypothetical protein
MWFLHRRLDSFIMMGQLRVITGIQQLTNFIQTGELASVNRDFVKTT